MIQVERPEGGGRLERELPPQAHGVRGRLGTLLWTAVALCFLTAAVLVWPLVFFLWKFRRVRVF